MSLLVLNLQLDHYGLILRLWFRAPRKHFLLEYLQFNASIEAYSGNRKRSKYQLMGGVPDPLVALQHIVLDLAVHLSN